MRISTVQLYANNATTQSRNASSLAELTAKMNAKSRIMTAGDDPVGAARLLALQQQSALLGQYSSNMTTLKNAMGQQESVLVSINDALQRASELTLRAGNGGLSDADRQSIAKELEEVEASVFGMMNSRDANGEYMFGGGRNTSPPYVRNADGTYSYHGDQSQLSLQVSDTLNLVMNETGRSVFDDAPNTSRTRTGLTAPLPNDGKVLVSDGLLTSGGQYDARFTAGQPYAITFNSATEYTVRDRDGNDITGETPGKGKIDVKAEGGKMISLRGVDFEVNFNLAEGDDADTVVAGHSFTLQAKPDDLNAVRSPGNPSGAQIIGSGISDPEAYRNGFPTQGAVIRFTSATDYEVYAQPYAADSKPIGKGQLNANNEVTVAGATFTLAGGPAGGDQFSVNVNTHRTQNVLDTIGQLRQALGKPLDTPESQAALKSATDAALSNLESSRNQLDLARGAIGARGNSLALHGQENEALDMANKSTQSTIGDLDMSAAIIDLTLQQTVLQASQAVFLKVSQLSLFDKL